MEISPSVHPASLPPGSLVGPWRLLAFVDQGSYGLLFRAERAAQPEAGPFALKIARQPGDARFPLEIELLSRVLHPHVPRLHDSGQWTSPDGSLFPFLVIDWVDGLSLYAWARIQPLTSRQVLRLLAQVARALQAIHEAGGLHRDVKGDNILVRSSDSHALLVDFGSCTWHGAPTLTRQSHPPGTAHYWSPQAQLHHWKFRRRPSARYQASPEDDVYALGVTAYRLVTGRYPLAVDEQEVMEEFGFLRFPKWVPAENLVHLSQELARWIGRMLSEEPSLRGSAAELARGLELAADRAGLDADQPIGSRWAPLPDAPPAPPARPAPPAPARLPLASQEWLAPPAPARLPLAWRRWLAEAALSTTVAASVWGLLQTSLGKSLADTASAQAQPSAAAPQSEETTGLGDFALPVLLSTLEPLPTQDGLTAEVPTEPLPGQRLSPCKRPELEINGGCWISVADEAPPCTPRTYEWKNRCYWPSFGPPRPATSRQK